MSTPATGRRIVVTAAVALATYAAIALGCQCASASATGAPPTTLAGATAGATAVRGTVVQVTPTLPPPVPAVPANSGTGRRAVYSKMLQRVWAIDSHGKVVRSYLVSGRMSIPYPGTYTVFSRSARTCSYAGPRECMRWMVRFAVGPGGGNIGFHEIPRWNGVPEQSDAQLGQPLSHGCVRQATADARFMWSWGVLGTTVVVLP
jgi:hypothetical protein